MAIITYGLSKFGREIIINEPSDLSITRQIFILITLIIGILAIFHAIRVFLKLRRQFYNYASTNGIINKFPFLIEITFLILILNITIHTAHYADNILRPVDYYEPKYLYRKYVVENMEITFAINF